MFYNASVKTVLITWS